MDTIFITQPKKRSAEHEPRQPKNTPYKYKQNHKSPPLNPRNNPKRI